MTDHVIGYRPNPYRTTKRESSNSKNNYSRTDPQSRKLLEALATLEDIRTIVKGIKQYIKQLS